MAKERVLVVGSGALGLYYGGRLAAAGHPVVFWARSENLQALQNGGLSSVSIHGDFAVPKPQTAATIGEAVRNAPFDVVLITLKSHHTAPELLAPLADSLSPTGVVLTLQNGVESSVPLVSVFGRDRVLAGIAFIGAERTGPGLVTHTAAGHIAFGEPAGGSSERAERLAALFQAAHVQAEASADIRREQWRKLVWNAPFNGITALTGRFAHETLQTPLGRSLVREIMFEVISVARGLGIELGDEVADQTIALTERTGTVRTSMLVDRERGRRMEIEAIYEPVLREARRLGIPTPALAHLYTLLQITQGPVA